MWAVPRAGRACPSELEEWSVEKVCILGRLPPARGKGAKTVLLSPSPKLPSLERAGEALERLHSRESPRHANRKPGKWGTPMLFFASTENFASNKVL